LDVAFKEKVVPDVTAETEVKAAETTAAPTGAAAESAADEFETSFAEFSAKRHEADAPRAADTTLEKPPANETQDSNIEKPGDTQKPPGDEMARRLEASEKRVREMEQQLRSEIGRQSALQRKTQELQAKLDAPGTDKSGAGRQVSARMKQLMEDFPEIAEAMKEELDGRLSALETDFRNTVSPLAERERSRELQSAETRVMEAYPDFKTTVNSPAFIEWYQRQPPAVQSLVSSQEPNDAIALLDYFSGGKRGGNPPPDARVQEIKAKRDAALQRNVSVRNTSAAVIPDAPDDFDQAFDFFARKRAKRAA
jgi:hypothetical protein